MNTAVVTAENAEQYLSDGEILEAVAEFRKAMSDVDSELPESPEPAVGESPTTDVPLAHEAAYEPSRGLGRITKAISHAALGTKKAVLGGVASTGYMFDKATLTFVPASILTLAGGAHVAAAAAAHNGAGKGGFTKLEWLHIGSGVSSLAKVVIVSVLGAKGIHVPTSVPGALSMPTGGGHSAAIESVTAATGNGTPVAHAQLDALVQHNAPNSLPTPIATPPSAQSGAETAMSHIKPYNITPPHVGAGAVTPSHATANTVPAVGQAPAAPAASSNSVEVLNSKTVHREWATATHPGAAGNPNMDFHFVSTKSGMTLELKDATNGTLLPNGNHLTTADLHSAKVLITVDVTGKGEHVIEVPAPGGKLVVGKDVADLIKAGKFSTVEVVCPGTGKDVNVLSTAVGQGGALKPADYAKLVDGLQQGPTAGQSAAVAAAGATAKPAAYYSMSLAPSGKPGVENVVVGSPSILTSTGSHTLTTSFAVVPVPSSVLAHLGHPSTQQWDVLNNVYKQDAAHLQQALGAEGLKAELIGPKGQPLPTSTARELLKSLSEKGNKQLAAKPIGDKLTMHNLVAPAGWDVNFDPKHTTLSFIPPHASKAIIVDVPSTYIKGGKIEFSKLEGNNGLIATTFHKAGYKAVFSPDGKMTITQAAAAHISATPKVTVPATSSPSAAPTAPATGQQSKTPAATHSPSAPASVPAAPATPAATTPHIVSPSPSPTKSGAPVAQGSGNGGGIDPTGVWDLALESAGGLVVLGGAAAVGLGALRRHNGKRKLPVKPPVVV